MKLTDFGTTIVDPSHREGDAIEVPISTLFIHPKKCDEYQTSGHELITTSYSRETYEVTSTNTFSNGCLGSHNDEERSEMRYVMRIAKLSESSKF